MEQSSCDWVPSHESRSSYQGHPMLWPALSASPLCADVAGKGTEFTRHKHQTVLFGLSTPRTVKLSAHLSFTHLPAISPGCFYNNTKQTETGTTCSGKHQRLTSPGKPEREYDLFSLDASATALLSFYLECPPSTQRDWSSAILVGGRNW